jgi:hypothetical protein
MGQVGEIFKTGWLVHANIFNKKAMEKSIAHVNLSQIQFREMARDSTKRTVAGLTTGLKVSS